MRYIFIIWIFIFCNVSLYALPDRRQKIHQKLSFDRYHKAANRDNTAQRAGTGVSISTADDTNWIVNFPQEFHVFQKLNHFNRNYKPHIGSEPADTSTSNLHPSSVTLTTPLPGTLIDIRQDSDRINKFEKFTREVMPKVDIYTDGESIDAIEHFFWGMENGLSLELGALDGSPFTHSQTYDHEIHLGWKRILVEANPQHRHFLRKRSPTAFSALAPICNSHKLVHYARGVNSTYVGGILEFMTPEFIKKWHADIYSACKYEGNITSLDYSLFQRNERLVPLACMPLSHILQKIQVKHVNLFILDVEGAELDILNSIDWENVVFDVICIETKGDRPNDYDSNVAKYLSKFGYSPSDSSAGAGAAIGRNTWYVHRSFSPQKRPGLSKNCFNGVEKSIYSGKWMELDGKIGPFTPCKLEDGFDY